MSVLVTAVTVEKAPRSTLHETHSALSPKPYLDVNLERDG